MSSRALDRKGGRQMSEEQPVFRRADIVLDLLERYYDRTYAFARKSVDAATAEDAVQETFSRLLQHPRLEELDISIGYMLRTVQNILRRRFRRAARLREIIKTEVAPNASRAMLSSNQVDGEERHPTEVDLESMERAMARLGADERDAIRLIVCEGLSYAEAARSLGVTVSTIDNWKHRGLGRLRKLVEAERTLGTLVARARPGRTG